MSEDVLVRVRVGENRFNLFYPAIALILDVNS
jgi:hypothetical protein